MLATVQKLPVWTILFGLFLLALIARVIGIDHGYLLADERINEAAKVLSGQLVPEQHFYPPLFNYINAIFFGLLYVVGRIFTWWQSLAEFRAQYFEDPTVFYVTARLSASIMAATIAPLFYLIATALNYKRSTALYFGLIGVLIPGAVLLSHIAKSDIALASAAVLVIYVLILKLDKPGNVFLDIALGLAIALAMSFKHSYIFALLPIALGYFLLFIVQHGLSKIYKPVVITSSVAVVSWCIFNIGILLDLQNFLEYQRIQAEMSVRETTGFIDGLATFINMAAHNSYGITWAGVVLFCLFPLVYLFTKSKDEHKAFLLIVWCSTVLSLVVLIYMSGTRQQSGLWIPYFITMQLFAAIFVAKLWKEMHKLYKHVGTALSIIMVVFSFYGVSVIWQQSFSTPVVNSVTDFVNKNYADGSVKIATSYELAAPQKVAFAKSEYARHERIAAKYGTALPERAPERAQLVEQQGALPYTNLPTIMFGLENATDESLGENIKPFAWPFQKEEWDLQQWLDSGYLIFVIKDIHYFAEEIETIMVREFFTQLRNRCSMVKDFQPVKPLLWEHRASIFDCRAPH
jgi:4-amino-4-deoxy-L-arabinose transferase-like glycosyltransferase